MSATRATACRSDKSVLRAEEYPGQCRVWNVRQFVPFAAMVSWVADCGVVSASCPVLMVLVLLWHAIVGVAVLADVYQLQDGGPPDST